MLDEVLSMLDVEQSTMGIGILRVGMLEARDDIGRVGVGWSDIGRGAGGCVVLVPDAAGAWTARCLSSDSCVVRRISYM